MTDIWKSGVSGDWSSAADWSAGAVPGSSDAVSIAAAGSYTVTVDAKEAAQSASLASAHATLAIDGAGGTTLTVANTLSVSAGTLELIATDNTGTGASAGALDGGTLTISSGGTLSVQAVVTATNQPFFEIDTVANLSGTTTLASGANISLSAGGTLAGTMSGAGGIKLFGSTFKVSAPSVAGIGYFDLEGATANFTAASGTIGGDTIFWDTSRINIAAASTITYTGALTAGFSNIANSFLSDSSYNNLISGPGTLSTVSAYVNTAGATTDELLVGGGLTWNNSGAITDYGQIAMNLVGGGDSFKLINNGILALSGNDAGIIDNYTDGTDTLINNGTLSKIGNMNSDGNATTPIDAIVNSTGIIDVEAGTLDFTHGGALSGTLSGAGTLLLLSGSYTVNGLSGTGHLSVGSGASVTYVGTIGAPVTLDSNETIAIPAGTTQTFSGPFTIGDASGGGTISGPGTLVTSGATSITDLSGAQALALNSTLAWTNSGTVTERGLVASSGAILNNTGVFDFASDSATFTGSGSTDIFHNTGTLGKTVGAGSSFLSDVVTSTGTINVATGALVLGGGGSISGVLSGAGALHLSYGTYIAAGLSGNGTLVIDNLPGAGYGTLTVSASSTISTAVRLDGNATIAGTAGKVLTISGPFAINTVESSPSPDGGNLTGPGTLATTGTTTIGTVTNGANYAAVTLSAGITWLNAATGVVTDGGSGTSDGGTIANAGVFNFSTDAASMIANSTSDIFRNTGTLGKTGGTGSSLVTDVVTSTGTINVATGALVLGGGGSVSGALSGAGALHLSNGSFTTTGLSGAGNLVIDNLVGTGYGTLTASATSTITASVRLDGNATLGASTGKNLTLTGPFAINTVESSPSPDGGYLNGPGTLTTTGMTTIGSVTNGAGYPSVSLLGGITWINSATGTVTDAGVGSSNGGTIRNAGVFNFAADTGGIAASSSGDIFVNTGTLGKTAGSGSSLVTDVVTSTGTINVATGALVLGGGGSVSGVLSGAGALHLSNGSFTTAGLSGAGHLVIDNLVGTGYGTLTASATSTITASVRLDGNATLGAATGTTLTLTGPLAINTVESSPSPDGGYLNGPGTLTTTGMTTIGSVTNGAGYPAVSLSGGITWINSATGTVTDAGVGSSNGGTIRNAGVFNFAADTGGIAASSSGDIFVNTGTLGKTAGSGSSLVTDVVTSTGTINVATGVLVLGGGGAVSGVLSGAGALHLSNGSFTTAGLSGTGNLVIDNLVGTGYGTLTASATSSITASVRLDGDATLGVAAAKILTLTGPLAINTVESTPSPDGGTLNGPGTLTTTGVTTIGTVTNGAGYPAVTLLGGITWINSATGTVTDAGAASSNGGTIRNAGVFNFAADTGIAATSSADVFVNTGTLGKTAGTGTSVVTDVVTSTGTINMATGALVLGDGGAVSGVLSGAGTLHLGNGGFTTTGITGAGTLVVDSLVGYGSGTLTASTTSTIATAVHIDGQGTLDAAAGATLTLLNQLGIDTVERAPQPDGGNLGGAGTIVTDNLVTIGSFNGNGYPALTLTGGVTWSNPSTVHDAGVIASNNATIANSGAFDLTTDTAGILAGGAADVFLNSGILAKTGGIAASTITDAVTNTGVIEASKGTLVIGGAVSGTGAMHIDAGATLDIANLSASQSVTFTAGAGATLRLETTTPISTSFTGFGAGDRLDFGNQTATTASISGTTLTVTIPAGTFTYVSAGLAGDVAAISTDATNGSFISIYRAATAAHSPEPLAFGNHHVGDTTDTKLGLTVSNTDVADGYSEKLNASLSGASTGFTAAGAVNGIAAGASNSTLLTVTLDTSTAGAKTGTAHLALATNGAGVDGRGSTPLPGQTVNLTGAVYAYAAAHFASTSVTLGNQHVGTAAHGVLSLMNSAAAGAYSEGLDASFIGGAGGATGTGTATLIAGGATNTSSLVLGLSASAAGTASGTETLTLISDGAGTSGLGTTALGTQSVTVSGTFYNLAAGHVASPILNLGVIHASRAATGALSLGNSAAAGNYSESLDAGLSGASAGVSVSGSVIGLAAGATNATALLLGVDTATTGAFSGTATLGLLSDGAGTSGLGTTALASQTVTVTATVDNYALAAFADAGGPAITGTSTNATINLGSALQGGAGLVLHLGADNAATGTADLLTGTISSAGAAGFINAGFGSIGAALSAGQSETSQTVTLSTTTAGTFAETVVLSSTGTNASGYNGALASETLTITGTITPSVFTTYTLGLGPNTITGANGKGDIFVATAGALNSRDSLTGGTGANSITLAGAGLFDVNAPALLSNIPTINAHEGQAASGTHGNTTQTVLLRDGATQTLIVAAGIAAAGNANPETIAIYGGTGMETIRLATGADHVYLSTGTDAITLGGAANSVAAGGGIATVHATASLAGASIVGTTSGSTTLAVSTGGAVNLNAADTYVTVQLSVASQLKLGALAFITAIGSAGADSITAGGAGQLLTGGLGADTLIGATAGGDVFADTYAGLNTDTIGNWTTSDQIDVRDIAGATATYAGGTLTIAGGGHSAALTISGSFTQSNFVVLGSDGGSGTLIGFHS